MDNVRLQQDLREWRQEAADRHQWDTAIYAGDKLLAITDDDDDACWLANTQFAAGNYHRCRELLKRRQLRDRNAQCRYLDAFCLVRLGEYEEALRLLGEANATHLGAPPAAPGHGSARQKLRHVDTAARAGRPRMPASEERDRAEAANLRAEAGLCYLRGLCWSRQNSFDKARDCFTAAVRIDVRCLEAFNALVDSAMMAPADEWAFLDSLDFDSPGSDPETADFLRNLYMTRLSKHARPADYANAADSLATHYNLADNPDMLRARAELMLAHARFDDALRLSEAALRPDPFYFAVLPAHIAALFQLGRHDQLFVLASNVANTHPDEPAAWLAVGAFYLLTNQLPMARRFLSKATQLNQFFGPAWIAYGHSFADEAEHDQAIAAYSTGVRLLQASHLPLMFLGMQNMHLGNLSLAKEYFDAAFALCPSDPYLLNEIGTAAYHAYDLARAIDLFRTSLDLSNENEADPTTTLQARTNLGHAFRRHNVPEESLRAYDSVLRIGHKDPAVFTAKGLTLMQCDRPHDAIAALHEALALAPHDPMATDLLNRALASLESDDAVFMLGQENYTQGLLDEDDVPGFEDLLRGRKGALRDMEPNRVAGRRRRGAGYVEGEVVDGMVVDE